MGLSLLYFLFFVIPLWTASFFCLKRKFLDFKRIVMHLAILNGVNMIAGHTAE
jgi:hypothetical protein